MSNDKLRGSGQRFVAVVVAGVGGLCGAVGCNKRRIADGAFNNHNIVFVPFVELIERTGVCDVELQQAGRCGLAETEIWAFRIGRINGIEGDGFAVNRLTVFRLLSVDLVAAHTGGNGHVRGLSVIAGRYAGPG